MIFSKINLQNTYHQIQIREDNKWKTAFQTYYEYFEYLVVPFGLINTPATFQSYINYALYDLVNDFCIVYLDNILVFSKSKKEYQKHLELVIKYLYHTELYTNPKKCDFFQSKIKYLGFIINKNGICMDPTHIKTILE